MASLIKRIKLAKMRGLWRLYLAVRFAQGHDTERFSPFGIPVRIPASRELELRYNLARGAPYEVPEGRMVQAYLPKGLNVIELGGCFGVISAVIRRSIGPEALHIIVEADPDLARLCLENGSIGARPDRTQVVAAAVDYSGRATVTFSQGHNANVGHLAKAGEAGLTVPTVTLAKLAQRLPEGAFGLVCDIEGAEAAMFAAETTLLNRIAVIILETHPQAYAEGTAALNRITNQIHTAGFDRVDVEDAVMAFVRPDAGPAAVG